MRRTAAKQPGASVTEVARRYGIDRRVLCRWKQELMPPAFVAIEVTDPAMQAEEITP
jgi:transposase-like protein